ncbi:MAG: zinc ABC transporter substrate-binding protein [Candidatus Omnitrophica bacterium]|nr:zinc ABC transporter substrate-binding protein [Candidatus Omnitrophota bacterium]
MSLSRFALLGVVVVIVLLTGCQTEDPPVDSRIVFVTIEPQAFLVDRIAGNLVDVQVMVPPGQPPETYEPSPSQVTELSKARIYFSVDVPFEKSFLGRVRKNVPHLQIVDTTQGIDKREIEEHSHGEEEDHGHEHAHDHGLLDPHVWLDPTLMVKIAKQMTETLGETFPESKEAFEANHLSLEKDLRALDERITEMFEPYWGRSMFVFHPAYGYFCDRYGLIQVPVESAGKEPNSKAFVQLIEKAKEEGVSSLFVQPQFSSSTVKILADEIGAEVVRIDPLKRDYLNNLGDIAERIAASFKLQTTEG